MSIQHLLAVAPVPDIDQGRQWYETLIGRPPDNSPMSTLLEWRVTPNGWLQVYHDVRRAGGAMISFAVADLDLYHAELVEKGLKPSEIQGADNGVRLSFIADPWGNELVLIGGFRIVY